MTSFASTADFANRLGLTLTDDETTRAQALLDVATGMIQDEAHQTIGIVTDDEWATNGTTDDRILLPERPVVAVASVVLDGQPLTERSDWYLDGDEIVRVPSSLTLGVDGMLDTEYSFPLGGGFGWEQQALIITYTHGQTVPETVKAICLEMVIRVWVNPGSVARQSVGATSTVYDNMRFSPSGLLLTDDEQKAITRLFGRRSESVRIGGGP